MLVSSRTQLRSDLTMVHQPRRTTTRLAGASLCGVIAVALLLGTAGPLTATDARSAAIAPDVADAPGADQLTVETLPVFERLSLLRADADLPALRLDRELMDSAQRDACAIARGELQLGGTDQRLAEAGGQRENVGLVLDSDPLARARQMDDWWTQSPGHRADRLHPRMHRYGIGACSDQERTYYVERFAS